MLDLPTDRIICADCMDILRKLPDKCIDLVLTDPPYGKGGDKQTDGRFGNKGGRFEKYRPVCRTGGTWSAKYENKIAAWDEAPTAELFAELFRVSKNQIIWGGNYFDLPPTRCFNVWRKLTISEVFTMAMCEYCWTSFDSNAKFWEYMPQDSERIHPTQKPVPLIMRQLEEYATPDMLILDPFAGSGTTAIACHNLGMRCISIERDEDYCRRANERLAAHKQQMLLPL